MANDFLNRQDDYVAIDLTEELSEINLPTLVLHGKYDLNIALESGKKYYELLGSTNKTFVQFDNSAHGMYKTETDKYGKALVDFIEEYR